MVLTAVQNSPERWYSTTVGQVSTLIRGLNRVHVNFDKVR